MNRLLESAGIFAIGYTCVFIPSALGQSAANVQNFPSRPITIVVPFPPGGLTDPIARSVGKSLSESLGQPVVVENKAGASGIVAAEFVKKSAADGHVILMAATGHIALNPLLFAKLSYGTGDFAPITLGVATPHLLVVPANLPANTVREMIALAGARPKGLTYASQGPGSAGHLLGALLKSRTQSDLEHVPYKGSGPGLLDLVAGRVDFFFDAIVSAGPLARDGRLKVLAVASPVRAPGFPNVPTMDEAGYSGVELDATFGFVAPAGTPRPVILKLNQEILRALRDPALNRLMVDSGLRVIGNSPEEYLAFIYAQRDSLAKVVKESAIRLD